MTRGRGGERKGKEEADPRNVGRRAARTLSQEQSRPYRYTDCTSFIVLRSTQAGVHYHPLGNGACPWKPRPMTAHVLNRA